MNVNLSELCSNSCSNRCLTRSASRPVEEEEITPETAAALDRAKASLAQGEGVPQEEILPGQPQNTGKRAEHAPAWPETATNPRPPHFRFVKTP
jgi:hypothetical protein